MVKNNLPAATITSFIAFYVKLPYSLLIKAEGVVIKPQKLNKRGGGRGDYLVSESAPLFISI